MINVKFVCLFVCLFWNLVTISQRIFTKFDKDVKIQPRIIHDKENPGKDFSGPGGHGIL